LSKLACINRACVRRRYTLVTTHENRVIKIKEQMSSNIRSNRGISKVFFRSSFAQSWLISRLHDEANVKQTYSKYTCTTCALRV